MTTTPIAWPYPPRAPSGDWGVELPGNASIGELMLWAKGRPPISTYTGAFIRLHQTGIDPAFDYLYQDPATGTGAGPGTNVIEMDCRLLCRFDPTKTVHLFSLEEGPNLMFWTRVVSGDFSVNWVSGWSTYLAQTRLVAVPAEITAFTWVWLRQRVSGGDMTLDYSLDHTNPSPSTWTPLGTWAVSSLTVRPSFGNGKPWFIGLSCSTTSTPGVAATGDLDVRRVSYEFNSTTPVLSTFEVDPSVVVGSFNYIVHADTANGNDYASNNPGTMVTTVESE
jgi:hypothetical protein